MADATLGTPGNCLNAQDISPKVPAVGDVLTFQTPGGWTPASPGSSTAGAIGLAIVFQPTPVPTQDSGNCYHSEVTFLAALRAILLATCGPIVAAVDSRLSFARFSILGAGGISGIDQDHRVTWVAASQQTNANILQIADGADLLNPAGVEDNLTVQCECATAPALVFTGSNPTFLVRHAASIVNNGAFALCNIAAGGLLQVMLAEASLILQSAAGVLFHLGAGSFLTTLIFDSASALSSSMNGSGVITGPVGSQWFDVRAPAGSPIDASTFLGTRHISYSAPATMLQYFTTNQATSVPSVSAITMQQAHMMGMTWVENVGANYTIDTGSGPPGSIDGAIRLTSEGKTITLPLAATFPGREITIIDASGGVAGFVMQPNVADSIGTAGAGVPVTNIPGQSLALTIKSMAPAAPTEWRIISSTLLS